MAIKGCIKEMGIRRACSAFGLSRTAFYRYERSAKAAELEASAEGVVKPPRPCNVPGRALTQVEEQTILDVLHSEQYVDMAPAEVVANLLDAGRYLCSVSTMYRILRENNEVKERRAQHNHIRYAAPELLATGINQVWSWDITRLKGPQKWSYYHLYVIIDIYSRYVVGWMVAEKESEQLAKELIAQSVQSQNVPQNQLTIHADRGSSMSSKTVAELLVDLGVTKSQSRPHVSNDNPYSESHFRTLKYRPEFPERFTSIEEARLITKLLIDWYNNDHYHSGIGFLTPASVHYGKAQAIIERRSVPLSEAYAATPQRFVNKAPTPHVLPAAVYINPPVTAEASRDASAEVEKEQQNAAVA